MKNKTPLRLVAIDGEVDDDSAVPDVEVQPHDAITRKVPNPVAESEASPATPPPSLVTVAPPRPVQSLPPPPRPTKTVLAPTRVAVPPQAPLIKPATAAVIPPPPPAHVPGPVVSRAKVKPSLKVAAFAGAGIAVVAVLAFALVARKPDPPTIVDPPSSAAPTAPAPTAATEPRPANPPPVKAAGETIRLQVTATPIEATLSLDGNVVAGHALNLRVPRDRGIHVISASAPGYIPFNQQVGFDDDVVLTMNLRRGRAATPSRSASRSRAVVSEPANRVEAPRAPVVPAAKAAPGFEPGMNLESPTARPNAKAIDERNPYKP